MLKIKFALNAQFTPAIMAKLWMFIVIQFI